MKALVTGGAGFIGSHIVDNLILNNIRAIIIDNLSTGKKENINPKAKFYQEDLSNFNKIEEIFEKEKPDYIFHLAAHISVKESFRNPIFDASQNIINTINLLELSVKYNIKHFIFSSTGGAIYGDNAEIPTKENSPTFPQNPYGCSKNAIEKYLIYYNKVHGLKFTCLRYSNVYGPRQNPEGEAGVIAIFFKKLFSNEKPTIFGGIQTRDFVFVGDIARANILALQDNKSNIYNVSTEKETDIIEVFNKINKYFNNKIEPEYQELLKGEQKKSCLSFEKINQNLNWLPLTNLDEGLDKTYCWYLRKTKKK
jgi:UDP-glucose 4-epimerase